MSNFSKILLTFSLIPLVFSSQVLAQSANNNQVNNQAQETGQKDAEKVGETKNTKQKKKSQTNVQNAAKTETTDITTGEENITIKYKYFNRTQNDQTAFVTMSIAPSITAAANKLASSQAFDIVSINEEYGMQFNPPSDVVESGTSKTREIKVEDASFVGNDNNLKIVLTPSAENGCEKTAGVKGCNWDTQNQNVWDPETFSCLSQGQDKCKNENQFKTEGTNILKAQTGGIYTIVLKPKANLASANYYFPLNIQTVQPNLSDPIINPLSQNITTQGTPAAKPLTAAEIAGLNISCKNVYVGTSEAICKFELPKNRTLPDNFKVGVGDVTLAGKCVTSKNTVNCENVPVVNKLGKEKIFVQIGAEEKTDTTKTAEVVNKAKEALKSGEMTNLACEDAVVNGFTNCRFEIPTNKYLPETFAINISDGAKNKDCRAVDQKVLCTKVATGSVAGKVSIFEHFADEKTDTKKTVNILPAVAPVAETGAGEEFLTFGFMTVLMLAGGYFALKTSDKNKLKF